MTLPALRQRQSTDVSIEVGFRTPGRQQSPGLRVPLRCRNVARPAMPSNGRPQSESVVQKMVRRSLAGQLRHPRYQFAWLIKSGVFVQCRLGDGARTLCGSRENARDFHAAVVTHTHVVAERFDFRVILCDLCIASEE